MIRSTSSVLGSSLNIVATQWTNRSVGFSPGDVRVAMCFDRDLGSAPPYTSGIYFVAGDAGKAFKTSTSVKSYNSTSTWTSVTSSFGSTPIYGGTQGSGEYAYLVGGSGKLARSPRTGDLSFWTQMTSSFGLTPIFDVVSYEWLSVAVGADGKLATKNDHPSATTIAWTQRTSSFGTSFIYGVCVGTGRLTAGKRYVAVGANGLLATWDTLGYNNSEATIYQNNWTQRTSSFGTTNINSVAWSDRIRLFVAVGDDGKMATSEDGALWTQVSAPPFGTSRVLSVTSTGPYGDLFIACGENGKLATSPDGSVWTLRSIGFSSIQSILSVDGNSTTAMAVGVNGVVSITDR